MLAIYVHCIHLSRSVLVQYRDRNGKQDIFFSVLKGLSHQIEMG